MPVLRPAAAAALSAAAVLCFAAAAGASPDGGTSVLVTPYVSAPGHGPSISAVCHGTDQVRIGSHPWDESHRNFQVFHDGGLIVNATTGAPQYWDEPVGDYTIRYAGERYEVDGDLCAPPPSTTTSTTTPPPSTTSTTSTTPTSTMVEPPTLTSDEPPATTVVTVIDWPSTSIALTEDATPALPRTGGNSGVLLAVAAALAVVGGLLTLPLRVLRAKR